MIQTLTLALPLKKVEQKQVFLSDFNTEVEQKGLYE